MSSYVKAWEYRRTYGAAPEQLNDLGRDGWELVAVVQPLDPNPLEFFWKRPRAQPLAKGF